jgi:hypothetical protein
MSGKERKVYEVDAIKTQSSLPAFLNGWRQEKKERENERKKENKKRKKEGNPRVMSSDPTSTFLPTFFSLLFDIFYTIPFIFCTLHFEKSFLFKIRYSISKEKIFQTPKQQ